MTNPFPPVADFFLLGKILKSQGTDGRFRVRVDAEFESYFQKKVFIFIDHDGSPVPYQIVSFDSDTHQVIALKGISNKEESDALAGKEIFITTDKIKAKHQSHKLHSEDEMAGYQIIDLTSGSKLEVVRTEELPQQLMAIVKIEDNERYIPLHDSLIHRWDHENKKVEMNLPEGLLEL